MFATVTSSRRRRVALAPLLLSLLIVASGCASSGGGSGGGGGSFNVLSGAQMRETDATNVWDALRRLRPQWLRARATASLVGNMAVEPVVYVQGVRYGELRDLQRMNLDEVREVEFIDAASATTRFGTGHSGGAIMVSIDRDLLR